MLFSDRQLCLSRRFGVLAVVAMLFAAFVQVAWPARPARAVIATDHVTFWNTVLLDTYRRLTGDAAAPTRISRAGAIMHVAIYDAANSVLCARRAADCLGQPYVVKVPGGGDFNTAVDYAASTMLIRLYPALTSYYEGKRTEAQDGIAVSPQQAAGRSVGEQAALAGRALALRRRQRAQPGYRARRVLGRQHAVLQQLGHRAAVPAPGRRHQPVDGVQQHRAAVVE